jgi:hypothetical protein
MSKILVAGDWHGNLEWAKRIIDVAVAEGIERLYQVGDFGVWPEPQGKEYLLGLSRYLVKQNKKSKIDLFFTPGNHEDYNQIDQWVRTIEPNEDGHLDIMPHIFYAGKVNAWTWEGKRFASVGGAVSIDRRSRRLNESWWPQEALTQEEIEQAKNLGEVDYLFTHDSPSQHPFNFLINHIESDIHRQHMTMIARPLEPKVWFHGHYHYYAEYPFSHRHGTTRVYSLDADSRAAMYPSLIKHTAVLDIQTGDVYSIDKQFNWPGRKYYFDRK